MRMLGLLAYVIVLVSCVPVTPAPVAFDAAHEACRSCRMTGSDGRTAGQLVTPGDEPVFFDDIGCVRDYLATSPAARGAVLFVTDYTTRVWVRSDQAAYVLQPSIDTPMASHLIAFASAAARDAAPEARGGRALTAVEVFGRMP